ncbi:MAG TPA: pyridine nucleotide-disulfide oxidoreductase, partial [Casimicrobiaceae bacterium]|nr:pyridine nucleotide-disulfide oxidoreductase [Casimicrobiaceae bacterium]
MPSLAPRPLSLPAGLASGDLYSTEGAARIDALFVAHLREADAALADRLVQARAAPDALERKAGSELLIALAPHVEDFLAALFGIVAEVRALEARHHELAPLYSVRRLFVQRRAMNAHKPDAAAEFDGPALRQAVEAAMGEPWTELAFANAVTRWQQDEAAHADALDAATRYAAWAAHTEEGRTANRGGILFRAPRKLDHLQLVPLEAVHVEGVMAWKHPGDHLRRREGFALTDPGMDLPAALGEAHYCIWCHEQGKDSCARGLPEKKPADGSVQEIPFRRSPFGVILAGCPLEEKISEFQKLRAEGWPLGALATMCVDNPLVAGTGHRICNDCMKGCIYQKTDPVNIPQIETNVLTDVLFMPYGFEIYSLLTRWNPLNVKRPVMRPYNGKNVLVVGLGPAGYTMSHYLLNEGFGVAGIDGLKVEPLP